MDTISITVQVPADLQAEFHRMFASWIEAAQARADGEPGPSEWLTKGAANSLDAPDLARAGDLWKQMSSTARKVLQACMRTPNTKWEGSCLASEVGLKSPHALAGALSWPVKYAHRLERVFPIKWKKGDAGTTMYWMDHDVIRLFQALMIKLSVPGDEWTPEPKK